MKLYEISHIRQTNRSLNKRWFTCREMNLIVWFRRNMPINFQLSFRKQGQEQTISWDIQRGFHLYLEDSSIAGINRLHKRPLLVNTCNQNDLPTIRRNFLVACEDIEVGMTDFIYARLMEYPTVHSQLRASHTDHPVAW